MEHVIDFWKGIVDYKGRATRKEFWVGWIGTYIVTLLLPLLILAFAEDNETLYIVMRSGTNLAMVAMMIPAICRRLRDAGFSAWFVLLAFIPVGGIVLIVFLCMPTSSKKEETYDKYTMKPVLQCNSVTGEQMAGFKNHISGEFTGIMMIRDESDLEAFKQLYQIEEDVTKEYL